MPDFPNYAQWVDVISMREQGLLLVVIVVMVGFIWAANVRRFIPQLYHRFLWALTCLFYCSLLGMFYITWSK